MAVGVSNSTQILNDLVVSGLVSDPYSCVKHVRKAVHIALPPLYIGKEHKGVLDIFRDWLYRYVKSLNGILLQFKNVSFVQHVGTIYHDQPDIHRDVLADFYVFQPSPGAILKGIVNKVSKKHVGCLVHDRINISLGCQSNQGSLLDLVTIGQEILFEVESIETRHKTMRVYGKITDLCLEKMQETKFPVRSEQINGYSAADDNVVPVSDEADCRNSPSCEQESPTNKKRKKKKKEKKKNKELQETETDSTSFNEDTSSKKHVKKKKKRKREEAVSSE